MTLFTGAVALSLSSCNNAEEAKKLQAEDDAKVQTLVDEQLKALEDEANVACATLVETKATELYTAWAAEQAKKGKKVAPMPKPKPAPVVETPKKEEPKTVGDGKPKMGGGTDTTTAGGKPKMGGDGNPNTVGNGKPKMGGSKP